MWLPEPIYKSLPTLYAAIGVLFILGVIYLGLDAPMGPVYLGAGLVSLLAAVALTVFRSKRSGKPEDTDSDDAPTP
ncbi:MAG: hypothetical protein OEQ90_07120 [Gammaproteobacteria bacterium]|nr:hypothetical protein [Gammaproteobacteria bacterium]